MTEKDYGTTKVKPFNRTRRNWNLISFERKNSNGTFNRTRRNWNLRGKCDIFIDDRLLIAPEGIEIPSLDQFLIGRLRLLIAPEGIEIL